MPEVQSNSKQEQSRWADDSLAFIDTTAFSFDMVSSTTNKGNAVLKLAELLGIPEKNIGAIGDYYNDIEMLSAADVAACPDDAIDEVKSLCKFIGSRAKDGAVADFIEYIDIYN